MALLRIAFLSLALAASARAVEIRFVPATSEGVVSLGIYDAAGKLVRLLCDEWPMGNFTAGLNGLSTEWDGKDSQGVPVTGGTYRARGFVIGNAGVEGEAIHFNDWILSGESPRVASVGATGILPGGDLLLAARLADGKSALLRYSPRQPNPWQTLPTDLLAGASGPIKVALADGRAFVLADRKIRSIDLSTGKEVPVPQIASDVSDLSARGDRLLVLAGDKMRVLGAADFTERANPPLPGAGLSGAALLEGEAVAAIAPDGSLWHGWQTWSKIEMPQGSKARGVAGGRAETFWVLEEKNGGSVAVVQYSPREGRLAEWAASAGAESASLAASTEEDYFCAVFREPAFERTVAIRRGPETGWEFAADKTITASASFGWKDGKLSPSSGDAPTELTLGLAANPLDPAAPRSLAARAARFPGGTGLATADDLPLVRVSEEQGSLRLMVLPGAGPDTARFFQGDGACVEEYKLTNLGDITAFDAGTIEMEGGAEKPAPPEEEITDPAP